jgi:hypothetical protein
MNEAIKELISMIESGREFPDAAWECAEKHGVIQQELEDFYDEYEEGYLKL